MQVVSKADPIKYITIEKCAVRDEISNGFSLLSLPETKIVVKNVFIANRDEDNVIVIRINSSLLEMIFDTKQHSLLLEMKKS